ncbi:MAG: CorA family divalent cation transporter [Bacteroidia bacterium]
MTRVYYHTDNAIAEAEDDKCFERIPFDKIFWVDLHHASEPEKNKVETLYELNFNTLKSENVLETNARIYESDDIAFISANFISVKENYFESSPVYIYLVGSVLITEREAELTSFDETIKKMKRNKKAFQNGSNVLEGILETKVDVDSDFIEHIAKEIATISRSLTLKNTINKEEVILKISEYQEATTLSRESFIDKQRVVSALMKCSVFENNERFKILVKDINAMLEYTSFIFVRLEYLQNTVLGLINIDQNQTTKIFTIVAVVFMPPTLIASIYGMNFKAIPELQWIYGYPFALTIIVASSLLTLFLFKAKRWL